MKPYPNDEDRTDYIINELIKLNQQFRIMNNILLDINKNLKEIVKLEYEN